MFKSAGKGHISFLFSLHVNGIAATDSNDIRNSFSRTAAGKIHDRLGKTLEERPQRRGTGQVFQNFITNIARNEIGKYKDIGLTGNGRPGRLLTGNPRYESRIGLHLAVKLKINVAVPQETNGLTDAFYFFAGTTAHGRIRQKSHFRIKGLRRPACPFYTTDGNISQLLRRRFDDDTTVADDKDAVIAKLRLIGNHDEGAAHRRQARMRSDDLQGCANDF